ncbi:MULTISPECIES: NAD(P)H-binding protein [unclassified Rhodococcus (in: high G+C Gram-positive bacteria)]|uniref:NAD(P)H-binding protein n=1 Tax=unclassified Rhodococcus (in: high G+C Gram-positive bacteria) TaxID=192944 RepID=UPI0006FFC975|nr:MULTISPECIES: NAD(P)H-binding protein [unclassified Rhodococcus (in: high G+C Gram-positive bacteria)]KQU38416.1 NAD(P)-dependent oxidoreductase [Rhodococcus sp. Leaf225]KQU39779.1 NAD(P)-dependent oxidoreductase [Rhodococcus sp. Leaf258]
MSRIVISGASGDLGRRVTLDLLHRDPHRDLTLVTRDPAKLTTEGAGVSVRPGDYQDRSSLDEAYRGGDILFLISGLNLGRRVEEHRNAIAAASAAGIRHIVYTSVGGVQPGNPALSAIDHLQTESDLRDSGITYTILRNQLYAEIVASIWLAPAAEQGVLEMATGHGSLAPVSKMDIARVVAAVLADPTRHANAVYEITGPDLLSMDQIVELGRAVWNKDIEYRPVSENARLAFFDSVGLPRTYDPAMPPSADGHLWASDELVSADLAVARGYQAVLSGHVEQITGQAPVALRSILEHLQGVRYDEIALSR